MTEPSTCPWCQLNKKVYVRAGSELVCTDCRREAEALDAMGNEALIEEATDGSGT